jgi:hypothetical protein
MDHKEIQAQVAKELTLAFAPKLNYNTTSSDEAMNEDLTDVVTEFYEKAFDTVKRKMEER